MNSQIQNDLDATDLIIDACAAAILRRGVSDETKEEMFAFLRTVFQHRRRVEAGAYVGHSNEQ